MAKNLLGGTTAKNYARGEAPPASSYEWAAAGSSPPKKSSPGKMPVIVATMRETIVIEKKPKKWKFIGIGAAVGAVLAYVGIKARGY